MAFLARLLKRIQLKKNTESNFQDALAWGHSRSWTETNKALRSKLQSFFDDGKFGSEPSGQRIT